MYSFSLSRDAWSMDDGRLTLNLCEEKVDEEEVNTIHEECCACEEAKYEVMFQVNIQDLPKAKLIFLLTRACGARRHIQEISPPLNGCFTSLM